MVAERLQAAATVSEQFLTGKKFFFSALKPSDLENRLAAVYAIFHRDDPKALYVGRTKNIRQRMYTNHLMGPTTNARLKKYLIEDETIPEVFDAQSAKHFIIENCYFQYLPEPGMEARGRLEGLFSYLLRVRYIHEEH